MGAGAAGFTSATALPIEAPISAPRLAPTPPLTALPMPAPRSEPAFPARVPLL